MSFRFETELCSGCYACVIACQQWHSLQPGQPGYRVLTEKCEGVFPHVTRRFESAASRGCDLCRDAGGVPHCALTCPTGALTWE